MRRTKNNTSFPLDINDSLFRAGSFSHGRRCLDGRLFVPVAYGRQGPLALRSLRFVDRVCNAPRSWKHWNRRPPQTLLARSSSIMPACCSSGMHLGASSGEFSYPNAKSSTTINVRCAMHRSSRCPIDYCSTLYCPVNDTERNARALGGHPLGSLEADVWFCNTSLALQGPEPGRVGQWREEE